MAKLSVLIGADDREFQAALKRASSSLRKLGGEFRTGVSDTAKWATALAAVGAAIAVHMVKQSLEAIDAQSKLAQRMNTTVASMAALERAADLDGVAMEQVEAATKKMQVALGQAAQGTGPAVDALARLHLSAVELSKLPLDQRISTINAAIKENIPLTQQAAVAADIYGSKAAAAMLSIHPETIKEAAEQAQLFGTALSDIDARKVELANDSFSRIKLGVDGFWKQISVKIAPILDELGNRFAQAVKEAGGMGNIATIVFNNVIKGAGFVIDAVEGIRRAFKIAADVMIIAFTGAEVAVRTLLKAQLALAQVSTLGMSDTINRWADENKQGITDAVGVIKEAVGNIRQTLETPLPSVALDKFVADAEAASQKAAEASVKKGGKAPPPDVDAPMDEAARNKLKKFQDQFRSEDELAFQHMEEQLKQIDEFEKKKAIGKDEANRLREEAEFAHWNKIGEIHQKATDAEIAVDKARSAVIAKGREDFLNNLSGLMNTENKKAFELGKKAAIASAAISGAQAVMEAWRSGMQTDGPWSPFVAAAYAAAAAANSINLINNIRRQQFGGGAGAATAPTQGSSGISAPSSGGSGGSSAGSRSSPTSIIHLNGDTFGRAQVRALLEQINEEKSDGGRIIFA